MRFLSEKDGVLQLLIIRQYRHRANRIWSFIMDKKRCLKRPNQFYWAFLSMSYMEIDVDIRQKFENDEKSVSV